MTCHRRRRLIAIAPRTVVLAVLLAAAGPASRAPAQGLPMLPSPVTTEELMRYADRLDLSAQQRLALLPVHDSYLERFRRLRDGDMQDFEDGLVAMASNINPMDIRIPPREDLEALLRQYNSLLNKVKQVDRSLFNEMQTVLTAEQVLNLDRVRYARERSMYAEVTLDIAGDFNDGTRVDLVTLVEDLDLTPDVEAQIAPIMRGYESEMLRRVKDLHDEVEKGFIYILDTIDRLGLRDMSMEEMVEKVEDEEFQQAVMGIFNEASRPFQEAVSDVSKLNLDTWRRIAGLLPEKQRREMRHRYFRRAYGAAAQGMGEAENRFRHILKLKDLADEQRAQIELERREFRRRNEALSEEMATLLEKSREYRTILQMEGEADFEQRDRIEEMARRREQSWVATEQRLRMILGPDLVAQLEETEPKTRGERVRTINLPNGETVTVVERDDEPAEAEDAEKVERDPFLPPPIGAGRLDEYAAVLEIDEAQRPILQSLYDDYRTGYDQIFIEPGGNEEAAGTEAPSEERRRLERAKRRKQRYAAIRALDDDFFDQLSLVTGTDDGEVHLTTLRRARQRSAATHSLERWGRFVRNQQEAFIDLRALLGEPGLPGDRAPALDDVLGEYDSRAAALLDEAVSAALESSRIDALVRVMTEQGNDNTDPLSQRQYRHNEAIEQAARDLARLNRETLDRIERRLDDENRWRLVQAYNEQVYPGIYRDRDSALPMLERALAMPGLGYDQQERIRQIASDYRAEYYDLSGQLVDIAKGRENFRFEGMIPVDMIRRELRGERLKFLRDESSARARARLRILLSEEQARWLREQLEEQEDGERS